MAHSVAGRKAERDRLLAAIVSYLRDDQRFVAAWLGGSVARGEDDAHSDLDLTVVVTGEASATLCARPGQLAGRTTPERLALFRRFGEPAIIHENHHNAPEDGSFTCVIYEGALTVDWVLVPQDTATLLPNSRILFEKAGIPVQLEPVLPDHDERTARASERVAFFWMMAAVTAKYLVRRDAVYYHILLEGLCNTVRQVEELLDGRPAPYRRGAVATLAATVPEQIAALRRLCDAMLALMSRVVSIGGYVPGAPMLVIEQVLILGGTAGDEGGES